MCGGGEKFGKWLRWKGGRMGGAIIFFVTAQHGIFLGIILGGGKQMATEGGGMEMCGYVVYERPLTS